jgi:hypothetical protein
MSRQKFACVSVMMKKWGKTGAVSLYSALEMNTYAFFGLALTLFLISAIA